MRSLLAGNTTTAIDKERTTVRAPATTAAAPNAVNLHRSPSPHEFATHLHHFIHAQAISFFISSAFEMQ